MREPAHALLRLQPAVIATSLLLRAHMSRTHFSLS